MDHPQKKQKLSHPVGRDGSEDADAGPSNVESLPEIFKLSIDCFDEIFEYLSLKDLHSFGQTCKRMNKVAGEYFKQNYSSIQPLCLDNGIYTFNVDQDGVNLQKIRISGFRQFVRSISIMNNTYIPSHVVEFESVKRLIFECSIIENESIKFSKQLFGRIEMVDFVNCSIDGDLYHLMLQHCGNLKKIFVREYNRHSIDKYKWLSHTYPKLEHFHLSNSEGTVEINELRSLFEVNPNVHRFSTDFNSFWENRNVFSQSQIKLDILELGGSLSLTTLQEYQKVLNGLHTQHFYKRIYIDVHDLNMDLRTFLVSLEGIESLGIGGRQNIYNLPQLTNLMELRICTGVWNIADMEMLANRYMKLECLYIRYYNSIDIILPFVRRSLKLNKIKVCSTSDNDGAIDLKMLNEERTKLAGAQKVRIYATDDIFLLTKWATKNGDTNLNLIEILRYDSRGWDELNV